MQNVSRTDVDVLLYIIAAVLEIVGVLTIGLDLIARRRRILGYERAQRNVVIYGKTAFDRTRANEREVVTDREPTLDERVTALEQRAAGEADRTDRAVRAAENQLELQIRQTEDAIEATMQRRFEQLVELIGPGESPWTAWVGFGALFLGVLVGTAGNLVGAG